MRVVATLRSTVAISAEVCPTQWDLILRAQPPPPHHRLFLRAGVFHSLCIFDRFRSLFRGVRAAFLHSLVHSTRASLSSFHFHSTLFH